VFLSVPSGRYQVQDPAKYAQVKRVAFSVMRAPVAPVRSRGHLGLVQPGMGVGVVDVEELLSVVVDDTVVVLDSIVEEAEDQVLESEWLLMIWLKNWSAACPGSSLPGSG
jgi:hypothetical protein